MKTVVITGSTRGIGFGLAGSFLDLNCNVVVSGRTQKAVDQAVGILSTNHPAERIAGFACDVSLAEQVQALWDSSFKHFGMVDIWINNAGLAAQSAPLWELPFEMTNAVVQTNLQGTVLGCGVALRGMLKQGHGAIYNFEGLGSDGGRIIPGTTIYATTKAALHYFNKALSQEVKETPVIVGSINPGMVLTNLVTGEHDGRKQNLQQIHWIMNIIGERVDTVAPIIAKRILDNTQNGVNIRVAGTFKVVWRFLTAPITKRNIFED